MSKIANAMLTVEDRFFMAKECYDMFLDCLDESKTSRPDLYLEDLASAFHFHGMMSAYADVQNELLGDDKLVKILCNIDEPEF